MTNGELKRIWKSEEEIAHIKGWDFSQIERNGQLKQGNGLFDFGDVKIHI